MNDRRVAGQGIQTVSWYFWAVVGEIVREVRGLYPNLYPLTVVSNQRFTQHGFRSVKVTGRTSLRIVYDATWTAKLASVKREFESEWPSI
jgi:hypothetical protein